MEKSIDIQRIKGLIKDRGWSIAYFCMQMGHARSWLVDMGKGRGLPDENAIKAIADKLNTTAEYLTDQSDQKNKPSTEAESLSDIENEILRIYQSLPEDKKQAFMTVARSLKSQTKDK